MQTIMKLQKFVLLFMFFCCMVIIHASNLTCYNIKDYGAKGDGKTLDSPAINKAIEAADKNGGGTVFLPAGTYLSGSIRMKSNINLYLDAGAVILAAPQKNGNTDYYDGLEKGVTPQYLDHGHTYFQNSLIWGKKLKNVSITGFGMIDGEGLVRNDVSKKVGFEEVANKSIAFLECSNVKIENITIFRGGWFAVLVTGCNMVLIDKVIIDTNRDGIDIDCCTNTIVSNCMINSPNDDGICPKSSYALGRKVITENLTITNCQVSGCEMGSMLNGTYLSSFRSNGRIKLGTESNGGFRNVAISNCTFRQCWGLAIECVDGGIMENISIDNLTMTNGVKYPIYITLGDRMRDPNPGISRGRSISISNVVANQTDSTSGISITGTPDSKLENIRLSNIRIQYSGGGNRASGFTDFPELGAGYPDPPKQLTPAYGIFARHIKNLELYNITFDYLRNEYRPAMHLNDIDGIDIDRFKAKTHSGIPIAQFEKINSLIITNSAALSNGIIVLIEGKWRLVKNANKYQLYDIMVDNNCLNDISSSEIKVLNQLKIKLESLNFK